jgi:hypothetical protein
MTIAAADGVDVLIAPWAPLLDEAHNCPTVTTGFRADVSFTHPHGSWPQACRRAALGERRLAHAPDET